MEPKEKTNEPTNMTTELITAHMLAMQAKINDYEAWDEARRMIINYLKKNHGLTDQYMWASKTIEIFQEHEKLKADSLKSNR